MDVTVDVEDVLLLLFDLSSRTRSLLSPAVVGAYRTNPAPSPNGNQGGVVCGRNDDDTNTNGGGRSDREQEGTLQAVTNPGAMETAIAAAIAPESNNSTGILANNPHHGRRHERTNITLVVPYRSIVIVVIRNSKLASRSCSRNLLLIATNSKQKYLYFKSKTTVKQLDIKKIHCG